MRPPDIAVRRQVDASPGGQYRDRLTAGRARILFLGVLTGFFLCYAVMAFAMDFRSPSGQIGPGFFPRLIGVAGVVLCVVALFARGTSEHAKVSEDPESADLRTLVAGIACCVGFVALLLIVGALAAGIVFLVTVLLALNPGRRQLLPNLLVGLAVPIALVLLFDSLNASLPG